jgi:hypothetical protein
MQIPIDSAQSTLDRRAKKVARIHRAALHQTLSMLSLLSRNSVRGFRASGLRVCAPLAKRLSSTQSAESKTETAADDKSMSFTEKMKATWDQSHSRIKQIGIYTGIGAVGFGVLTGVVDIMEYVGSMSFITVGEFAFEAGLVTAGLIASAFLYVRSHFFIMDPRKILDMCLKRFAFLLSVFVTCANDSYCFSPLQCDSGFHVSERVRSGCSHGSIRGLRLSKETRV